MKHMIYQYDLSGQNKFEPSWYADVWASDLMLKIHAKGMPYNNNFCIDRKAIPQLIRILQAIENERQQQNR